MIKRALLRYHGSKFSLAPWVISFFPPHKVYTEPFGGGASVLLRKHPSITEIYNDLDGDVVNLFRVLRDPVKVKALIGRIGMTPYSRQEYKAAYNEPCDDVDSAYKLFIRSFMGMSSKGIWKNSGFDTRINPDAYIGRVNSFRALPSVITAAAERLSGVVIEHGEGVEIIERFDRHDALTYCDPPYVKSTCSTAVYKHGMTDDDHIKMAAVLHNCEGMVLVSGYQSELYKDLFHDWTCRQKPHTADVGKKSVESIWMNKRCAEAQPQGRLAV